MFSFSRSDDLRKSNDDTDSLGLDTLFNEDESFGLDRLFAENEAAPVNNNQAQPNVRVLRLELSLQELLFLMQFPGGIEQGLEMLPLLRLLSQLQEPGLNARPGVNEQPQQTQERPVRGVDNIPSPVLRRHSLFRCPEGGDHLHDVRTGQRYTGPLPSAETQPQAARPATQAAGNLRSSNDSDDAAPLLFGFGFRGF